VLILGSNMAPKAALFRATAGIWRKGKGRIIRPEGESVLFLAERPYVPPGTLREVLDQSTREHPVPEEGILGVLRELSLDPVMTRAGDLDREQDWETFLSLSEQKLLAFARILFAKPGFAFLDRPRTSLTPDQVKQILGLLSEHRIGYLTIGEAADPLELYNAVLEIAEDGTWTWRELGPNAPADAS